jgi:hypothetical protein
MWRAVRVELTSVIVLAHIVKRCIVFGTISISCPKCGLNVHPLHFLVVRLFFSDPGLFGCAQTLVVVAQVPDQTVLEWILPVQLDHTGQMAADFLPSRASALEIPYDQQSGDLSIPSLSTTPRDRATGGTRMAHYLIFFFLAMRRILCQLSSDAFLLKARARRKMCAR